MGGGGARLGLTGPHVGRRRGWPGLGSDVNKFEQVYWCEGGISMWIWEGGWGVPMWKRGLGPVSGWVGYQVKNKFGYVHV